MIGLVMLLGFAWWTWHLHGVHSGWQWVTSTLAAFGFFGMLGSRTPVQPPVPIDGTSEPVADVESVAGDEPPASEDDGSQPRPVVDDDEGSDIPVPAPPPSLERVTH